MTYTPLNYGSPISSNTFGMSSGMVSSGMMSSLNNNEVKNNVINNNNLIDIIKSTLPLIILGSNNKSLSELLLMPIICFMIIKMIDYLPFIFNKLYYLLNINKLVDKIQYANSKYQYIITEGDPVYNNINRYVYEHYQKYINYTKLQPSRVDNCIYTFDNFDYQDKDIQILKRQIEYNISSNDKNNINKFMEKITKYAKECFEKKTGSKISIYDWNNKNYECKKIVHCNKNVNNIFLSEQNFKLINFIKEFKTNIETYSKLGIPHKLGIIMYGFPGCGKSSTIYAIADIYNKKIYKLNLKKIKNKKEFDLIRENIPKNSIVVMEDIDCVGYLNKRSTINNNYNNNFKLIEINDDILNKSIDVINMSNIQFKKNGESETMTYEEFMKMIKNDVLNLIESYRNSIDGRSRIIIDIIKESLNEDQSVTMDDILEFLDGYHDLEDSIIIMTTNYKNKLDDAVIRHGRMDLHMEFKLCNKHQFNNIFEFYTNKKINDYDKEFNFKEDTYSTATIINEYVLPYMSTPELILQKLNNLY